MRWHDLLCWLGLRKRPGNPAFHLEYDPVNNLFTTRIDWPEHSDSGRFRLAQDVSAILLMLTRGQINSQIVAGLHEEGLHPQNGQVARLTMDLFCRLLNTDHAPVVSPLRCFKMEERG